MERNDRAKRIKTVERLHAKHEPAGTVRPRRVWPVDYSTGVTPVATGRSVWLHCE
jgi:hypothetical protein